MPLIGSLNLAQESPLEANRSKASFAANVLLVVNKTKIALWRPIQMLQKIFAQNNVSRPQEVQLDVDGSSDGADLRNKISCDCNLKSIVLNGSLKKQVTLLGRGSGCSTAVERISHNREVMGSIPTGCLTFFLLLSSVMSL